MCGIIGYTGPLDAKSILLEALAQLEYRGYDSAGIALVTSSSQICMVRETGKVMKLKDKCNKIGATAHCGIGHTRWATHGAVSLENTHPHQAGKITLIHNGIIENYLQLIQDFNLKDRLVSQTDSEVAAWVLNKLYQGDPEAAIWRFLKLVKGSYSFCILFGDYPGEIYAVRNVSPMVAAYTRSGSFVASDLTALMPYTKQYMVVPENHILRLTAYKLYLTDQEGNSVFPEMIEIGWNTDSAMKNGFPHYMLKEINEQPEALKNTILPRLCKGLPHFSEDKIPDSIFCECRRISIVACGTAMYAGMAARSMLEPLLRMPVTVSVASEFRYEEPLIDKDTLVIIVSQSGETIDTLAALRLARNYQATTLAIVNVKGSTIARESDYVFYTHAGPEIAVASTKAYSVQLAALYLIGCKLSLVHGIFTPDAAADFISQMLDAIPAMETMLRNQERVKEVAAHLIHHRDVFFIGRGPDYAFSLEGALKLKEISYIHAEAYAAGELKHGTIALVTDGMPIIVTATQEKLYSKTISNVQEVRARGAFIILITQESAIVDQSIVDIHLTIPDIGSEFTVFPIAVLLQLIAYYTSVGKNLDVDQPRNLAKSVTVE